MTLTLDPTAVRRARELAARVGQPIVDLARAHTTVSVERATLRLGGITGADPDGTPWANRLLDVVRADVGLEHGVTLPVWDALVRGEAADLTSLAQKAAAGSVRFRLPEGDDRARALAAGRAQIGAGLGRVDDRRREREQLVTRVGRPAPQALDLPHRGHRRHLRGHPAGPGRRPGGRRRHRGHPLDRPVAAGLRARGTDPGGVRRHLRHPGELPADAGRARRDQQGARPLRPPHQLRLRPLHAGDGGARGPRAARHDAQRLDVRDPLPRHQPDPHVRRPALQPPGPRPRRDHHQHRRGQLPHHRRRRRGRPHRHHQPAAQRVLRQGGRASRTGSSGWATPSRSTRRSPTRSAWSWPTPCWPATSSPTPR